MAKSPTDYLRLERIQGGEIEMRLRCRECGGSGRGEIEDEYGSEPACKVCGGSGHQVDHVSYDDLRRALRRSTRQVWDSRSALAIVIAVVGGVIALIVAVLVLAIVES